MYRAPLDAEELNVFNYCPFLIALYVYIVRVFVRFGLCVTFKLVNISVSTRWILLLNCNVNKMCVLKSEIKI